MNSICRLAHALRRAIFVLTFAIRRSPITTNKTWSKKYVYEDARDKNVIFTCKLILSGVIHAFVIGGECITPNGYMLHQPLDQSHLCFSSYFECPSATGTLKLASSNVNIDTILAHIHISVTNIKYVHLNKCFTDICWKNLWALLEAWFAAFLGSFWLADNVNGFVIHTFSVPLPASPNFWQKSQTYPFDTL